MRKLKIKLYLWLIEKLTIKLYWQSATYAGKHFLKIAEENALAKYKIFRRE